MIFFLLDGRKLGHEFLSFFILPFLLLGHSLLSSSLYLSVLLFTLHSFLFKQSDIKIHPLATASLPLTVLFHTGVWLLHLEHTFLSWCINFSIFNYFLFHPASVFYQFRLLLHLMLYVIHILLHFCHFSVAPVQILLLVQCFACHCNVLPLFFFLLTRSSFCKFGFWPPQSLPETSKSLSTPACAFPKL